MEFTVKRSSLLSELNLVQGVIERKTTIPILSNILIEASGSQIGITATDLDVSICCGCEAEIAAEGTMTVSARRLFDIVRLLPEDSDIRFSLLENDWVEVRSGSSEYKVVGLPKENFPSIPQSPAANLSVPGNVLRGMIQRTMFAITQEESRYSLNGALLVLTPQEIRMVATDGHRLALVSAPGDFPGIETELRSLIPRKTLVELQKLIGDQELFLDFARDENHLFFSVGTRRLVSRILAGQFPNYEMVIPKDNDKSVVADAKAVGEGVRRVAVMSDDKMRAVRMSFTEGVVEMTASSAEAGEAREVVSVEYQGQPLEIGFNPQYILDFLGAAGAASVSILLKDGETQAMFMPANATEISYRYVVMPMKF